MNDKTPSSLTEETPVPTQMEPAASAPATQKVGRSWKWYLVRLLALFGLIFVVLAAAFSYSIWEEGLAPIKENAAIESTMNAYFGRYSAEHKGWLYVTDAKRTYLMRVVQQANIDDKQEGDGLYFVASGTPMDDKQGTLYGVFYLHKDPKVRELQYVVSFLESKDLQPLTPELVRFEALSNQVWAWVVKEHSASDDADAARSYVANVVLAPHDGEIKELARFDAQRKVTPTGGCAKAEEARAQWLLDIEQLDAAEAAASASSSGEDEENNAPEDIPPPEEPTQCTDLTVTYKTNPPKDGVLTPLLVNRTGMSRGKAQPKQSWKIMFDPKSFVYLVPDELKYAF